MSKLKELIESELGERDYAHVGVPKLYEAGQEYNPDINKLVDGFFFPEVGLIGEWSPDEKKVIKNILRAGKQEESDDLRIVYEAAYKTVNKMEPGDIARVYVGQSDYLLLALPAELPVTSLVLFVK